MRKIVGKNFGWRWRFYFSRCHLIAFLESNQEQPENYALGDFSPF